MGDENGEIHCETNVIVHVEGKNSLSDQIAFLYLRLTLFLQNASNCLEEISRSLKFEAVTVTLK